MFNNSQDCQQLIKNINSAISENPEFIQKPQEQYKQRNNYIEILDYAIEKEEWYHLYDIWQVFAQTKGKATRGFFLDLWDISKQKEFLKSRPEADVLRHFIGQMYSQFDQILEVKKITTPRLWQDYVQELLSELILTENQHKQRLKRQLLYSMCNLYGYLYPKECQSTDEEIESLILQLEIAEAAIFCQKNQDGSSIVLNEVFSKENQNSDLQRKFTLSFLYLYRFAEHFDIISLKDYVKQVVNSLPKKQFIEEFGQEKIEELLNRLLRFWGANTPLIELFLEEKLEFKFHNYKQREEVQVPCPHGTDNYVYTIGASGVGKTSFFHAMEYYSNEYNQQPLSIKYIDKSIDSQIDKQKWKAGQELKAEENYLVYMRSKVRNLCRFTFYEIENKQVVTKDYNFIKWLSLEGYFQRHLPSAITLVFSSDTASESNLYSELVNLLANIAKDNDLYRNIPIYFIFNKSDLLLTKLQQEQKYDLELLSEFQNYLKSQVEISQGFNFFSLRYQQEVQQNDILTIFDETKNCCKNLAFLNQLNTDIKKVKELIDKLLNANFSNLNFMYTSSVFEEDNQYSELKTLWSDLSSFIIKANYENLKKYYQDEFQHKLENDFEQVNYFLKNAKFTSTFEDDGDRIIYEKLNKPMSNNKMEEYFYQLQEKIENNKDIDSRLILSSFDEFATEQENLGSLEKFLKRKEYQNSFISTVLQATLEELGIPLSKKNHEDFYLKEIEFIEPRDINYSDKYVWQFDLKSTAVEKFIEHKAYLDMKDKIKDILKQKISEYNSSNSPEHKLEIYSEDENLEKIDENLEKIIEQFQLDKQLQAMDIANRNNYFEASLQEKFNISYTLSDITGLCPIQSGKFEDSDRGFILGGKREQTVFERLCELANQENKAKKYCQLLSNYLHSSIKLKYPQFILAKINNSKKIELQLDEIKINVNKVIAPELKKQQDLLLKMAITLLDNWSEFHNNYEGISDINKYTERIYKLLTAKQLLSILKHQGFRIEDYQKKPEQTISKISKLYNDIANAMNQLKFRQDGEISLNTLENDYREINRSTRSSLFNNRDFENNGNKIEVELKTALNIYNKVFELVDSNIENLTRLSEGILHNVSFSRQNEFNVWLNDYERERKKLILLERINLLVSSKWTEDSEFKHDFLREYYGDARILQSLDSKELEHRKNNFIDMINDLLKAELYSYHSK